MLTLETSVANHSSAKLHVLHSVIAYDYIDKATGDQDIHIDLCSFEGDYCSDLFGSERSGFEARSTPSTKYSN